MEGYGSDSFCGLRKCFVVVAALNQLLPFAERPGSLEFRFMASSRDSQHSRGTARELSQIAHRSRGTAN